MSSSDKMSAYQSFAEIIEEESMPIHHVLPQESSSRSWQQYIYDLDYFFTRVYRYHRRHGFVCIVLNQLLELVQFVFIVLFTVFLIHGVNYNLMFKNIPKQNVTKGEEKVKISDVLLPWSEFNLTGWEKFFLVFAGLFWAFKLLKMLQSVRVNAAIKAFYREALDIRDCNAYTWQAVQQRLINAQRVCLIQDTQLNELDVHNRILRHSNYLVALMNKGLIPLHYRVPFLGEVTYLSHGLIFNINYLLFRGPFSLFETNWRLKDIVRTGPTRQEAAKQLARNCLYFALLNLVLFPFIALWQLLTTFYAYAEAAKRDPSMVLGSRTWSLYARWYCRHFNELDHLLEDRLNRGYKCATKYMNSFTSPSMEIVARHVAFMAGAILAVLIILTIYDEDVITVEHVITVMTGLGAIIAISRAFIAPEVPQKYTQADLYTQILEHVHYVPHGYAPYSAQAQNAMSKIFQYKISSILEELISPLATPYILARYLRPRAQELVDFFRNFTVDVQGTGDVCVFAMLNIKDNGNSAWRPQESLKQSSPETNDQPQFASQYPPYRPSAGDVIQLRAPTTTSHAPAAYVPVPSDLLTTENGKLELSLINFKLTNPEWRPVDDNQQTFINFVTSNAIKEDTEEPSSNEISQSNISSTTTSQLNTFQAPKEPILKEVNVLSHERHRILNEEHDDQQNTNLAMTLSTLFLHEYATAQSQSGLSTMMRPSTSRQATESEPLLGSRI